MLTNYCERKAKGKGEEEGGMKAKKKVIKALRDPTRYLDKQIATANIMNLKTEGLKEQTELLRFEIISLKKKISASMDQPFTVMTFY